MSIGQREKATQKRVIKLFVQELGYTYLGDFTERKNANKNCSRFMPLYWKKPPRANGNAARMQTQPISPFPSTGRNPK